VYQWITAIAWEIYKPLLSGPTEMFVPEHTRDAFFQLWCDLRTNVPKDRKWLTRHALALKPQTLPGWIALSSAALFASAGSTAFLSMSLAIFAVITYTLVTVVTVSGLAIGFSLLVISAASIVAALVTGWFAMCAAAAYAFVASLVAVFSYGLKVFKGTPLGQAQGKKHKPKSGNKLSETPNATSLAELDESIARSTEEDRADEASRASASQASNATCLPPSSGRDQFNDGIRAWKEKVADSFHSQPGAQIAAQGNDTGSSAEILKEKIAISPVKMDSGTV
jgi:hypothetical protein